MKKSDAVVALFADHASAETAVKALIAGGFAMTSLSVIGKSYHIDEKVVGFYTMGDRVRFWGTRGAFWGGLWGLFLGGVFITVPPVGPLVLLGYLATAAISALEGAVLIGGISAIDAAFYSLGVPKDSVLKYRTDIATDGFLVMAHGDADEIARAKAIIAPANPLRIDVHAGVCLAAAA